MAVATGNAPYGLSEETWGLAIAGAATVWFTAVCLWEVGAPFGAGHYAAAAAVGVAGENVWRFGTLLPVTHHPFGALTSADYYTHHPFGIFWLQALFSRVLGHHDWVCRLPAVLESACTPPLLYAVGRALFGVIPGALGALFFTFIPIALAFGNFNALEVPVIFGTLLATFAVLELHRTGRRRYVALGLGALVFAVNADWAAFVFAGALLALTAWSTVKTGSRRLLVFTVAGALLVLGIGLGYLAALHHLGKLDQLLAQGRFRAQGAEAPLWEVLYARRHWLLLCFTPIALIVGAIATPLFAARAVRQKNELQLLPLALFAMAAFQYFVFEQGADVHVFWPHYFAPYSALGFAALTTLVTRPTLLLACAIVPLSMATDAIGGLVYARKTGGRFDERGAFIQPDKDKVAAFAHLARTAPEDTRFALARNVRQSLWVPWVLDRPARTAGTLYAPSGDDFFVTDGRFASVSSLARVAREHAVSAIGPFWVVEWGGAPRPLTAFAIERREPTWLERYWVSGTHALREVTPDPFATWELRDHLGQTPNPWTTATPATPEQVRVAHNAAVARGEHDLADELLKQLLRGVDQGVAREFPDGTRLLGVRYEPGASDVLSVYFRANGKSDGRFAIDARLERTPLLSLIPRAAAPWPVGLPPFVSPNGWKAGYVYSSVTELLRRPGRERYVGRWESPRASDPSEVPLLVVP